MDVLNALYATIHHLVEHNLNKATVTHTIEHGDRIETLTITVRRKIITLELTDETEGE